MSIEVSDNRSMMVSKRIALRSGFGIIIGLLILSTLMAYRVQESFSARSAEIHHKFVVEQELLTSLRRVLWAAAVALRDHFINPSPNAADLSRTLNEFEATTDRLLNELQTTTARPAAVQELRTQYADLWATVRIAAGADWDAAAKHAFVQEEVVPRRDAAGRLLRQIEVANTTSLATSEVEFR